MIGFISPFIHIIYGINGEEGIFGYKYMSSFLYAMGNRVCLLSVALLMLFASSQIINEYKKAFKFIAYMLLYIAAYFIIHILVPKGQLLDAFGIRDFHPSFYYISMAILAITSGMMLGLFHKAAISVEEKLKAIISRLFDFIIVDTYDKIDQTKIKQYEVEYKQIISEVSDRI